MTATSCLCPHCGNELTLTLTAPPRPVAEPAPVAEQYIEPCLIADRLGLSEGYVRRIIRRGIAEGMEGFAKRGGRLFATVEAVKSLGAF